MENIWRAKLSRRELLVIAGVCLTGCVSKRSTADIRNTPEDLAELNLKQTLDWMELNQNMQIREAADKFLDLRTEPKATSRVAFVREINDERRRLVAFVTARPTGKSTIAVIGLNQNKLHAANYSKESGAFDIYKAIYTFKRPDLDVHRYISDLNYRNLIDGQANEAACKAFNYTSTSSNRL